MLIALILLSCTGATDDSDPGPEPALTHRLTFAVLADPHITTGIENQERLAAAVAYINEHSEPDDIELVWIVGDIGWDGGLPTAKALLDELTVPYVPVLGDNEVHFGAGETFQSVFTPQYEHLAGLFDNFTRGQVEVFHPVHQKDAWMQNLSFDYQGLHWVGLDWISRHPGNIMSEFAELNDFDGGTMPFFEHELATLDSGADENVLLFSHHAMYLGLFNVDQLARVTGVTNMVSHRVAAAYAGHFHLNYSETVVEGGYDMIMTDATFEDENTIRLVQVWGNGNRFEYVQELIVVP